MPRTGENIYKRKDGRWEGRYLKDGTAVKKRYGYIYGKTYKEVKRKLTEVRCNVAHDQRKAASDDSPEALFSSVADSWIQENALFLKESSLVKYKNLLRLYLLPALGECLVSEITNGKVSALCNDMLSKGGAAEKGLSPKTVSDVQTLLRNIVKYAGNIGLTVTFTSCPVSIRQQSRTLRVFSIQEQRILTEYLKANPSLNHLGFLLCLFTGIRVGELCALKWEDVSLTEKTIHIRKTMQRLQTEGGEKKTKITITSPKSGCSIRVIPIPEIILEDMRKAYQPGAFLLTGKEDEFTEPRTMQNRFKALLKKCGIDDANFHALRHTFATRCVEVGADTKSLSEILGHANVNITLNRYVHPTLDLKRENMDRLSHLFTVR